MKVLHTATIATLAALSTESEAALVATWTAEGAALGNPAVGTVVLSSDAPVAPDFSVTATPNTVTDLTDVITLSGSQQAQLAAAGLPVTQGLDNVRGNTRRLTGDSFGVVNVFGPGTGNVGTRDATLDFYISPDNLNDARQLVFETGGSGAGISLFMIGSTLTFGAAQNAATGANTSINVGSLYDAVSPDTDDMLIVRLGIDLGNDVIELSARNLSTGLGVSSSTGYLGNSWSGTDSAAFFNFQGTVGGSAGGNVPSGGYSNFDGQFAGMQFHTEEVLEAVPEPSHVLPLLALLVSSIVSSRRRKRNDRTLSCSQ